MTICELCDRPQESSDGAKICKDPTTHEIKLKIALELKKLKKETDQKKQSTIIKKIQRLEQNIDESERYDFDSDVAKKKLGLI